MRRSRSALFLAVTTIALAIGLPLLAGEAATEVKLTGWITDEWCGSNNANAEGKSCALACAKKGAALVLFADGKTYKLSDQQAAAEHVGIEVVVTGTLAPDGSIRVSGIAENRKEKKG